MLYNPKWKRRTKRQRLADIYNKAADAINQHGHSIGLLRDSRGRMCVWGAIAFVMEGNAMKSSTRSHRALNPLTDFLNYDVVAWNNKPKRTKRQVVNMLRRAARSIAA